MADRDRFFSQPPSRRAASTADKEAPVRDAAMLGELADLLTRVEKAARTYGTRIEALRLGCEAAGLRIPGGAAAGPAPPTAATAVIAYLGRRLPDDPALDRAVRLAVSRHAEALRLADEGAHAQAAGQVAPALLEGLRRELYFLGHLYETFRHDAVLRNVFPAPQIVEHGGGDPAGRQARRKTIASALERVRKLHGRLAGPMDALRRVIMILDGLAVFDVRRMLEPGARNARIVALALHDRPEAVAGLRDALERHERLTAGLAATGADDDPEPLVALASSFDDFILAARADPLLRPLFPPDPHAAFPPGGPGPQSRLTLS